MKIRSRDRAVPYQTKDGSLIRSIMDLSNSPVENLSLAEATVSPGSKSRLHLHTRSEEIYYLLQGKGRIYIEGKSREVARFDAILIPPGTKHYIENVGQEDLIFLCLCSPPYTHQATKIFGNSLRGQGSGKVGDF